MQMLITWKAEQLENGEEIELRYRFSFSYGRLAQAKLQGI